MAEQDERRKITFQPAAAGAVPFPRALPPRSAVSTPARIPQRRLTSQFDIGSPPPAGPVFQAAGNRFSDQRTAGATQRQQPARQPAEVRTAVAPTGTIDSLEAIKPNATIYSGTGGVNDPARRPGIDQFLRQGEERSAQARTQQRAAFDRGDAVLGQISRRNALENASREARIAANSVRRVRGSRSQRELQTASVALGQQAADAAVTPRIDQLDESAVPQGFANAAAQRAGADAAAAQAQGQALTNQAAQRQQALQQQLAALSGNDPQRRATIDQLLVGQGKDPDAGRFLSIDVLGPTDAFGNPTQLRGALDTRSGQLIGGGGNATAPSAGGQLPEGAVIQQNGKTFRIVNGQPVPLEQKAR
jgi:hypothetical protein